MFVYNITSIYSVIEEKFISQKKFDLKKNKVQRELFSLETEIYNTFPLFDDQVVIFLS